MRAVRTSGCGICPLPPKPTSRQPSRRGAPRSFPPFTPSRPGPLALRMARRREIPLVVTLPGTDANHELMDPEHAPAVRRVLEGAMAVTAFDGSIAERVAAVLPDVRDRLVTIPQAVFFARPEPFDLEARWPL